MKSVAGAEYLFIRRGTFYFRYKLPKSFIKKDIRISLKTQSLSNAIAIVDCLTPLINSLRILPSLLKISDKLTKEQAIITIKLKMKKQLEYYHIDQILTSEEVAYRDSIQVTNALSRVHLTSDTSSNPNIRTISAKTRVAFSKLCKKYDNLADIYTDESVVNDPELLSLVLYSYKFLTLTDKQSVKNASDNPALDIEIRHIAKMMHLFNSGEENEDDDETLNDDELLSDDELYYSGISTQFEDKIPRIDYLANKYGFETPLSAINYQIFHEKLNSSDFFLKQLTEAVFNKDAVKIRELEHIIQSSFNAHSVISPAAANPVLENNSKLFSQVYQEFLTFKVKKQNLSEKIQKDYARFYEVWSILTEDKAIDLYEPRDIGLFIDQCFDLPKMNVTPYNKMTMQDRVTAEVPDDKRITPKSVQGYYKWLQSVFSFAGKDTIGYIEKTPCRIKRDFTQNKRGPFTNTELKSFEAYALTEETSWKKWSLLLAIYTGARRGELFQLRGADIKQDSDSNLFYILITDEHESQQIKTENARRRIPVHSKLIEYGFLDLISKNKGRLLDGIENRNTITAWFGRLMEKMNVSSTTELAHIRSFHSFRHSFITKIRNESLEPVELYILQQIVGHELSNGGITDNYTHHTAPIAKLSRVVEGFKI